MKLLWFLKYLAVVVGAVLVALSYVLQAMPHTPGKDYSSLHWLFGIGFLMLTIVASWSVAKEMGN